MLNGSSAKSKIMFRGDSCFPISPLRQDDGDESNIQISISDQIIKILEVIGTQQTQDTEFITDDQALTYLFQTQERLNINPES